MIVIFTDGSKVPGEKAKAYWVTLKVKKGDIPELQAREFIIEADSATNNVAEWMAVEKALEDLLDRLDSISEDRIFVFSDSQVVVRHILGIYKKTAPHLLPIKKKVLELKGKIHKEKDLIIAWIPREFNIADPNTRIPEDIKGFLQSIAGFYKNPDFTSSFSKSSP